LITASLKTLKKDCYVVSGEIGDAYCLDKLSHYSKAAMLKNRLRGARFGYSGHKPEEIKAIKEHLEGKKVHIETKDGTIVLFDYADADESPEDMSFGLTIM
jgi:hypothetical protein